MIIYIGMLKTAFAMKDQFGLGVFYDGIYPKLIRATVSHIPLVRLRIAQQLR